MPINVTQGDTILIAAQFVDANGVFTFPAAVILSITYPTGRTTAVALLTMKRAMYDYIATWDSTVSDLGFGTLVFVSPANVSPPDPLLRIVRGV